MHRLLIFIFFVITTVSCSETKNQFPVISTDISYREEFENTKPSKLSKNELAILEQLILRCISGYNIELKNSGLQESEHRYYIIDEIDNYKRQYVPVINEFGEKIVWVNSFCSVPNGWDWQTQILGTDDGGNCYFTLSVNLTKKTCSEIMINGYA